MRIPQSPVTDGIHELAKVNAKPYLLRNTHVVACHRLAQCCICKRRIGVHRLIEGPTRRVVPPLRPLPADLPPGPQSAGNLDNRGPDGV